MTLIKLPETIRLYPKLLQIIPIFFLVQLAYSQPLQIDFKQFSNKDGLVQSPISCFLQDHMGFIWFGNLKGLTRFDGYEFKVFTQLEGDTLSLSNNRVNTIFQDSENNIWVGTANGVNIYNSDLETFRQVDILDIKGGQNYISSIVEDDQKDIWVGTFAGLKKINKSKWKLEDVFDMPEAKDLNLGVIFSLYTDSEGHIWAGTKKGLYKFDPQNKKLLPLPDIFSSIPSFSETNVLVCSQDEDKEFWFGTETSGVFRHSPEKNTFEHYSETKIDCLPSNWVKDILVFDENNLWFATQNGISIFNKERNSFSNYKHDPLDPKTLNNDAVWAFLKDKAGCVWIGTYSGGINFYYKGTANFLNIGESAGHRMGFSHPYVTAVAEDSDNSLWVGTYGGGLTHLKLSTNTPGSYDIQTELVVKGIRGIRSLAEDKNGNLWIGSLDGLARFDKNSKRLTHINLPVTDGKLSQKLIHTMVVDGDGVWIGTNGNGLKYVLPDGSKKSYQREGTSLSDNFVTSILKEETGNLWIATQDGLNYYDKKSDSFTKLYRKAIVGINGPSKNSITTLHKDSQGRFWVGTEGGGLNYFDERNEKFYVINQQHGLLDNVILSIVEDDQQNLWLSTDKGLFKVKIKVSEPPFKKDDLEITLYSTKDGVVSDQFAANTGLKLKSGHLAFGGVNGLTVFEPQQLFKNNFEPNVVFTELLINNKAVPVNGHNSPLKKSISKTSEIVLNHNQSYLSFKFSALNYINPENNHYAYQLKGMRGSSDWQQIGNQRVVNFATLPPGTYTLNIKASNNDYLWSSKISSILITVLPPWWKTWWAYLIYSAVFILTAFVIVRFLKNRADLQRNLYLEHVQNERQQELYQMKLNFFTHISHEIRTPLTLILAPIENLLSTSINPDFEKKLSLIKNNADRLMKLVTELMDFRKAEEGHMKIYCASQDVISFAYKVFESFRELANQKKINYRFKADQDTLLLYFDSNHLEKVLFNLLSNAIKFTEPNGEVSLSVGVRPEDTNWADIIVHDNGKGIPLDMQDKLFQNFFQVDDRGGKNIGSGIGLALSKNLVELHKGSISLKSYEAGNDKCGSTSFTVSLRTGKDHLQESEILPEKVFVDEAFLPYPSKQIFKASKVTSDLHNTLEKRYTVLIAEDNDEVRELIIDQLNNEYEIMAFSNGTDALKHMKKEIPDLIISDVMMPGIDGLELCTSIKTNETTSHIPVILLTAKASVVHQVDGLSTGADAYITKPFVPQVLSLKIKNLLQSMEIMREKFSQQLVLGPTQIDIDSPEDKFLNKLMDIIENNLGNPEFGVDQLVNEIGVSRTVLYKKVQALTNFSIADLIKNMRLKKAALLFSKSTLSISEVAYDVGFNDRKHFSKEFRKLYGLPPTEYIKKVKEEEQN